MKLKNKVALITGGSRGIGKAIAERFIQEGAKVIICNRTKEKVQAAVQKLKNFGKEIYGEVGDLSVEQNVERIFEKANEKFGGINILVNAAGVCKAAKFEEISLADWHYVVDNNLTMTFLTCKHVLKYMKEKKYGKIINVSSIAGRFRSKLAGAHYSSSKAAIITLTRQLAAEVGKYNINVNVVCPGQTRTAMLEQFLNDDVEKSLKESIPLGYVALPEQQAEVILFLASEQANYVTGAAIDVNGGQF